MALLAVNIPLMNASLDVFAFFAVHKVGAVKQRAHVQMSNIHLATIAPCLRRARRQFQAQMKVDTEKTATFEVKNPATGETIASVPEFSRDEVAAVVDRLRSAQPAWERLDFKRRYSTLKTFGQFMLDNEEEFTDRLVEETGKARSEAPNEILVLGEAIRYYGRKAAKFLAEETPRPHSPLIKTKSLKVVIRPQPVIGLIGPWNFPINLTLGDAVPALMAGCAVVIKPSEFTPLTLSWLVRSWVDKLGLPPVLDVVTGLGKT